jgi:hypothetical protein
MRRQATHRLALRIPQRKPLCGRQRNAQQIQPYTSKKTGTANAAENGFSTVDYTCNKCLVLPKKRFQTKILGKTEAVCGLFGLLAESYVKPCL